MHECPECGQACDCDGEDTWIGWPANIECSHDCEDEWRDESDFDEDYEYPEGEEYEQYKENIYQKILRWIRNFLYVIRPFRCDVCGRWSVSKHRPCCSQKCADEWVPF